MSVMRWVRFSALPVLLAAGGIAIASSGGPPAQRTGAPAIGEIPAESSCHNCHSSNTLNSGATIEFVNAPNYYSAGQTYTFSVQLSSTQTAANTGRKWSFELTAVNQGDGNGAGTFANVVGQETQIKNGTGNFATRRYIQSYSDKPGATTPVAWQVQWTAPDPNVGAVGFYVAAVAANGTGNTSGDWVATASRVMEDVTPTEAVTWGGIKAMYR